MLVTSGALAQSWLPWTTREEPAPRREPAPRQVPNFGQFRQPGSTPYGDRSSICLQLEQRLAEDAQRQANSGQAIQNIRSQLQSARRSQQRAERQLDRQECYETFLFTRSLKPSRSCRRLDQAFRDAARKVEQLNDQLRQFDSGVRRDQQDEIIRALARNKCGRNYEQAARQRDPFNNFWQDNDDSVDRRSANIFGGLPFATYRTVCVRLCDGYYFPVSFSTLPNHFDRDQEACQSKCAAPTELYFHQNPGGSVDQMVAHRTQQPYSSLRTAFRYRKEFVAGCSCKADEYVPQDSVAANRQPAKPNQVTKQTDQLSPVR